MKRLFMTSLASWCGTDNYVHDMQDAGIAILESFDSEIYNNVFVNVKYGIRISLGGGNNYVHDNTFDTCSQCECPVCRGKGLSSC